MTIVFKQHVEKESRKVLTEQLVERLDNLKIKSKVFRICEILEFCTDHSDSIEKVSLT